MLEAIITYLNLKLGLLNYFDLTRCLCELKVDGEEITAPKEYISEGNFDNIDFDSKDGVSYWRLRDEITTTPVENTLRAGKRVQITVPLKLVFSVRRDKLTQDDAYSFDRIRQTIIKQFNIDDGDLKTQLGAEKITVTSPTANGDPKAVWDGETDGTGTLEPKYEIVFGSVDIDVVIISKKECLPTECDDVESDILKTYDFCLPAIQDRLTATQVTCLDTWLCGTPDPVTEQINGVTIGTAASGSINNQVIQDSAASPVGTGANPSVIADSTNQVNGVDILDPTVAEGTHNQQILNGNAVAIGSAANPSLVASSKIQNSATPTWSTTVEAEENLTLAQAKALDSDGTTTLLADYIPAADGFMFTCSAASAGSTGMLLKTGQTVSYRTGDDGDLKEGRATDFFTLAENNYFGNTDRFTDELGGQTYANDIVIDSSTHDQTTGDVLGWYRVVQTYANWNAQIDNSLAFSVGTFTTGWYLPNVFQLQSIMRLTSVGYWDYAPFNIAASFTLGTSTTNPANTAQLFYCAGQSWTTLTKNKTLNTRYLVARTFNTSEL